MAVPLSAKKTVNRVSSSYTVDDPDLQPPVSTLATAPNVGRASQTPPSITLLGADTASATVPIAGMPAGSSFTFALRIAFPGIPSPVVVGANDDAALRVHLVSLTHGIKGLVLAEVVVAPFSQTRQGSFNSETLQPGMTYQGWGANVSGVLYAALAVPGGTLTARATGVLYDILGSG